MKAMVLCAGLGTRLRPLTSRWPKPAVPLLGRPLIGWTFAALRSAGVTAVGINTHHLPELMERTAAEEAQRLGLGFTAVHEPQIQGTAGGIRGLRRFLEDDAFLVVNGDVLFAVDLAPVVAAHRSSGAAATMVLLPMPEGERYAAVELDSAQRVRRIAGRGPGGERLTPWHFTGVHVLDPSLFEAMSPTGPEDINRDVYLRVLERGGTVRGHVVDPRRCPWSDLGSPPLYAATHRDLLFGQFPTGVYEAAASLAGCPEGAGRIFRHPAAELSDARVSGPALFAEGARLEGGVRIGAGVSVGRGARVGAGAALNRVAVLDGALVHPGEHLEDCLVLPGGDGGDRIVPVPGPA